MQQIDGKLGRAHHQKKKTNERTGLDDHSHAYFNLPTSFLPKSIENASARPTFLFTKSSAC